MSASWDKIIVGEVEAIVRDTERCAGDIFEASEAIVEIIAEVENEQLRLAISDNITKIFEACHFQDFAGQRATKIIENINDVAGQVGDSVKLRELSEEESLKQGPQLEAASQEDIDKLFDDA